MNHICRYCGNRIDDNDIKHHLAYKCEDLKKLIISHVKKLRGHIFINQRFKSFIESFIVNEYIDGRVFLQLWYDVEKPGLKEGERSTTVFNVEIFTDKEVIHEN